jgi:hypothetical protein
MTRSRVRRLLSFCWSSPAHHSVGHRPQHQASNLPSRVPLLRPVRFFQRWFFLYVVWANATDMPKGARSFVRNLVKDKVIRQRSISPGVKSQKRQPFSDIQEPIEAALAETQRKSCWVRSGGRQTRNSAAGTRFENRTAEHKEQPYPASPSFDSHNSGTPKIPSFQFFSSSVFIKIKLGTLLPCG